MSDSTITHAGYNALRTKRQNRTFVFATSGNWPGKREWASRMHTGRDGDCIRFAESTHLVSGVGRDALEPGL